MDYEDSELVALIDNELDEESRRRLLARIEENEDLRSRYEALRSGKAPIGAAFDMLLERAPTARLKAALPKESAPRRGFLRDFGLRDLAAAFVAGFIIAAAAGLAAYWLAARDEDDWRSAVVSYMDLYNKDTFDMPNPDASLQARELSAVGGKVGADLTPEKLALPGLTFKVAFTLAYEGSPLGEMAFVDAAGEPALVCVIADKRADAPVSVEKRGPYSLASWAKGGRGYLVIGSLSEQRAGDLAHALSARI